MRATRRHAVFAAVAILAGASACASLLGVEDVGYSSDAGADRAEPGDSPLGESAPPDGGPDGPCGTATDSLNCGRCGHSCFGGQCANGVCEPVIVASGELGCAVAGCETMIAADDDAVYWITYDSRYGDAGADVTPGHLARATCDASTCSPKEVLVPGVYRGGALSIDGKNAYFATGVLEDDAGAIYGCAKGGCDGGPTALCGPNLRVDKTAVHLTNLYWTDDKTPAGSVFVASTSGCNVSQKQLVTGGFAPGAIAADKDYFYVTTGQTVMRAPVGSPVTIKPMTAPEPTGIFDLALDGTHVYWTVRTDGGGVYQCGRADDCTDASAAGAIARLQRSPGPIAVDSTGAYWINTGAPSAIAACATASCVDGGPVILATGQAQTTGIAVNKDSIFWANSGDGTIMRLAKP